MQYVAKAYHISAKQQTKTKVRMKTKTKKPSIGYFALVRGSRQCRDKPKEGREKKNIKTSSPFPSSFHRSSSLNTVDYTLALFTTLKLSRNLR